MNFRSLYDTKQGVIADDFTGAADTGVQYLKGGWNPIIWNTLSECPDLSKKDLLVLNSDSRFLSCSEADNRIHLFLNFCRELGIHRIYKKVDSILRGNVAIEISAAMKVLDKKLTILAPAAPRNGRTVIGGVLYVGGRKISQTPFGTDNFNSIVHGNVLSLFHSEFGESSRNLFLDDLRKGTEHLRILLQNEIKKGCRLLISDSETVEDLEILAELQDDTDLLFAGSSGLAEALNSMFFTRTLIAMGSLHPGSRKQIAELEKDGDPYIVNLLPEHQNNPDALKNSIRQIDPHNPVILLRTPEIKFKNSVNSEIVKAGKKYSGLMGQAVKLIMDEIEIHSLVLIGGDTATSVIEAMGNPGLTLEAEILPGVPLMRSEEIRLVSKSGGFGEPDTLKRIVDFLQN